MITYSSYTNHLRFFLRCYHSMSLPQDLQQKSRIKTERSKAILQRTGKLKDPMMGEVSLETLPH